MDAVTYMYILAVLAFGLQITTAIVLIRKYLRTRAIGFVWLAIAAVLWPFLNQWPQIILHDVARHQVVGPYPYSVSLANYQQMTPGALALLLYYLRYLIDVSILLAAVVYLVRPPKRVV